MQVKPLSYKVPAVDSFRRLVPNAHLDPDDGEGEFGDPMTYDEYVSHLKTAPAQMKDALKRHDSQVKEAKQKLPELTKREEEATKLVERLTQQANAQSEAAKAEELQRKMEAEADHAQEQVVCAQDPTCSTLGLDPTLQKLRAASIVAIEVNGEIDDALAGKLDVTYSTIGDELAKAIHQLDLASDEHHAAENVVSWYDALTELQVLYADMDTSKETWAELNEAPMELTRGQFLLQKAIMQQFANVLSDLDVNYEVDDVEVQYYRAYAAEHPSQTMTAEQVFDEVHSRHEFYDLVKRELTTLQGRAGLSDVNFYTAEPTDELKTQMLAVLEHTGISEEFIMKQAVFTSDEDGGGGVEGEEVKQSILRDAVLQLYRSLVDKAITEGTYKGPLSDAEAYASFFDGVAPSVDDMHLVLAELSPDFMESSTVNKLKRLEDAFGEFLEGKLIIAKAEASVYDPEKETKNTNDDDDDEDLPEEELTRRDIESDAKDPYAAARNQLEARLTDKVAAMRASGELQETKAFNFDVPEEVITRARRRGVALSRSYNVALTASQAAIKFKDASRWSQIKSKSMTRYDNKMAKLDILEELNGSTLTDPESIAVQDRLSAYTKELIWHSPSEFATAALPFNQYWLTGSGSETQKEEMYQIITDAVMRGRDAKQRKITEFISLRDAVALVKGAMTNNEYTVNQALAEAVETVDLEVKHPAIMYNITKMGTKAWLTQAAAKDAFTMDDYNQLRSADVFGQMRVIPNAEDLLSMNCAERVVNFGYLQKFAEDMQRPVSKHTHDMMLVVEAMDQEEKKKKGERIVNEVDRFMVAKVEKQAAVVEAIGPHTMHADAQQLVTVARRIERSAAQINKRPKGETSTNGELYRKLMPEIQAEYARIEEAILARFDNDKAAFKSKTKLDYDREERDVAQRQASADILDVIIQDLEELHAACTAELGTTYFDTLLKVVCGHLSRDTLGVDPMKLQLLDILTEVIKLEAPGRWPPTFLLTLITDRDRETLRRIGKEYWIRASLLSRCAATTTPYHVVAYQNAKALIEAGHASGKLRNQRALQSAFLCVASAGIAQSRVIEAGREFDPDYWSKSPKEQRQILVESPLRKEHLEDYMLGLEKSDEAGTDRRALLEDMYETSELASRLLGGIVVSVASKIRGLNIDLEHALSYTPSQLDQLHPLVRAMLLNYAERVLDEPPEPSRSDESDTDRESDTDSESDTDTESDTSSESEDDYEDNDQQNASRLVKMLGSTNGMLQVIADIIHVDTNALDPIIAILQRLLTTGTDHVVLAALNAVSSKRMTLHDVQKVFSDQPATNPAQRALTDMLNVTQTDLNMALGLTDADRSPQARRIIKLGTDVDDTYWDKSPEAQLNLLITANKRQQTAKGVPFVVPHELLGIDVDYNAELRRHLLAQGFEIDQLDTTRIGRAVAQRALFKLLNPSQTFEWFQVNNTHDTIHMSDFESSDESEDEDWIVS